MTRSVENFESIYEAYAAMLYGYILTKTDSVEIASRIFMATFIDAFRNIELYSTQKERMFIWLRKLADKHMAQ